MTYAGGRRMCCFIRLRAANTLAGAFASGSGVIASSRARADVETAHDNAPMERLFRSMKTEWIPAGVHERLTFSEGYRSVPDAVAQLATTASVQRRFTTCADRGKP